MKCVEARFLLQQRHDEGRAPRAAPGAEDDALARHVAGCAACARFARFLGGLGGELRGALEAVVTGMPDPDLPAVFAAAADAVDAPDRARFTPRRLRLALAASAAVLVAGLGLAGGVRAWIHHRDRILVAGEVSGFVDDLFAEPLLADAGLPVEGTGSGLRAWLEGAGESFLP